METLTKPTFTTKKAVLALVLFASAMTANAQGYHYTRGYYRGNGTYVQPHWQGNPDGNPYNNLGYPGGSYPYFIY